MLYITVAFCLEKISIDELAQRLWSLRGVQNGHAFIFEEFIFVIVSLIVVNGGCPLAQVSKGRSYNLKVVFNFPLPLTLCPKCL